jgi:hypothetical protein
MYFLPLRNVTGSSCKTDFSLFEVHNCCWVSKKVVEPFLELQHFSKPEICYALFHCTQKFFCQTERFPTVGRASLNA